MTQPKYLDYCIINEIEAGKITGINVNLPDGSVNDDVMPGVCRLREYGVSDWIVIHALDANMVLTLTAHIISGALDIRASLSKHDRRRRRFLLGALAQI